MHIDVPRQDTEDCPCCGYSANYRTVIEVDPNLEYVLNHLGITSPPSLSNMHYCECGRGHSELERLMSRDRDSFEGLWGGS